MKKDIKTFVNQGQINSLILEAFGEYQPKDLLFVMRNEEGRAVPAKLLGCHITFEAEIDDAIINGIADESINAVRQVMVRPTIYSLQPVEEKLIKPGGSAVTHLDRNLTALVEHYGRITVDTTFESLKEMYEECPRYRTALIRQHMKKLASISKSYMFENDTLVYS